MHSPTSTRMSQMPRLHRRRPPIIIGPIDIPDRRRNQFLHLEIIQTGHRHRNKRPAQHRLSRRKHIHPTHPAKAMPIPARPQTGTPPALPSPAPIETLTPPPAPPRTASLYKSNNYTSPSPSQPGRSPPHTAPPRNDNSPDTSSSPPPKFKKKTTTLAPPSRPAQLAHCGVQCPLRPVSAHAPHPC